MYVCVKLNQIRQSNSNIRSMPYSTSAHDDTPARVILLNRPSDQSITNQIKSTQSTWLTFIPLNIIRQFSNFSNLYFVCIAILQMVPSITLTQGKPTILLPLSFVVLTVMIKDACEEFQRYRKDRKENNRNTLILKPGEGFVQEKWMNIQAGHVIKILQDQIVPCDALVLSSNLPDNKCYLETKNLDGETSQKLRKSPYSRTNLSKMSVQQLAMKDYRIDCQQPNTALEKVQGFITMQSETVPFEIQNVLLRGCTLRNCKQVICVALYVGADTKVILNSAKFGGKQSVLMLQINKLIMIIFMFQMFLSVLLATLNHIAQQSQPHFHHLIQHRSTFAHMAASWGLLLTHLVPISLIVTTEVIKFIQGIMVHHDRKGYSHQYGCFTKVNNTSVNQNLGMIRYVLTDKTGTLTKNQMKFHSVIADNRQYFAEYAEQHKPNIINQNNEATSASFDEAMRVMSLCHDIVIAQPTAHAHDQHCLYQSSSPDQVVLATFAKSKGFELVEEQDNCVRVFQAKSQQVVKYQKLAFLHFSSDRKRMSVIVRLPNRQIMLYMKGADVAVQKRLKPHQKYLQDTQQFIERSSLHGLRTLMLARKAISEAEFARWHKNYIEAKSALQNRSQKLEKIYEEIQWDLDLVGGVAIQDKLQEQVAETIITLKKAGMKFLVLTGDKKQTAVSIGRYCGLISPQAPIFSFPQDKQQSANYRGSKVYLLDCSHTPQYPDDMLDHQTICYRCTPAQKETITRDVKNKGQGLTLAIGDGANDVNMILAADVGVGVRGKEGTEAARAADIVIGQFKFLAFITLYYGRQWYKRNIKMVGYNFFKNWFHTSSLLAYGVLSYFSAVIIYDMYTRQLFNAAYTAMPIVIYAVIDKDYSWQESKQLPELYAHNLSHAGFSKWIYAKNMGLAILYGSISMLAVTYGLESEVIDQDGRMGYLWQSGAVIYFNIVLVANFRVLMVLSHKYSLGLLISVLGGIMLYWAFYCVEAAILKHFKLASSIYEQWTTLPIHLMHFILLFMFIGVEYIISRWQRFSQDQDNFRKGWAGQDQQQLLQSKFKEETIKSSSDQST